MPVHEFNRGRSTGHSFQGLSFSVVAATVVVNLTFAGPPFLAEDSPVQKFHIEVDQPAYTNLPLWIRADLKFPLEVHFPYQETLQHLGPNQIELKREGQIVAPMPTRAFGGSGLSFGSIAPASSPINRLPLHLRYSFSEPGKYSVRWTLTRQRILNGAVAEVVVGQSDWLNFEVKASTGEQREAWLQNRLAKVPSDPGLLVGDWIPSALVAAPDSRVLKVILGQLFSESGVVSPIALTSTGFFPDEAIRQPMMDLLANLGPSERAAYYVSWREPLFHDHWRDIIRIAMSYLRPETTKKTGPALQMLGAILHNPNAHWPADPKVTSWGDKEVLRVAPRIVAHGRSEARHALALYLSNVKTDGSRELLWELAERPEHEQALSCLTWIGDPRDLPRLGEILIAPGDPDPYGREMAGLPYSLMRGYGDRAIPALEKALADSPYPFVRTTCAEELALRGRPAAFRFFLDAVENDRFYKAELINWLRDHFPKEVPRAADEATVISFLKSRLQP